MSLHADLSPEALARLQAQRRNSTISSLIIAFLMIVLIGLVFGFILLPHLVQETPTIVTYQSTMNEEQQVEQKKLNNTLQRRPSAPSSSMAKVIAAATASPTAVPVPEIDVPEPTLDFGDGDDFGDGWGSGDAAGGGGFGSIPATMRKRCSPEDRMQRLLESGGTPACEEAVVKGLQWLKATQNADGSWDGRTKRDDKPVDNAPAMTGLALLAYLGHCETPLSQEYGESCLKAITWLVNLGMRTNGKLSTNTADRHWPYEHSIATYALAEAATFCKQLNINVPHLFEVTQKATQFIVNNQNKSGGWEYSYQEGGDRGGDLSITAWHMQALKAASHTGLEIPNLARAGNRAINYIEGLQNRNGGFGYSNSRAPANQAVDYFTMTGGAVLCLQMWDQGARSSVRNGARYIETNTRFEYDSRFADLYGLYYEAQAMMNRGGEQWKKYNALFRDQLLKNQLPDGSWKNPAQGRDKEGEGIRAIAPEFVGSSPLSIHYRTCLAILTLEVYYRFLPGTGEGVR